jgi:hypothetical protein
MALRTKIQTFSRKQDFNIQMHIKANLEYGIQLWGCAKPWNTKIIQRLQSNVLRTITNAPWYISNFTLHNDLQIPLITEEIKRYSTIYYNRLIGHENSYITELGNLLNVRRRLKRTWPCDLKDQREEKKKGTHNIIHSIYVIGESSLDDRSAQVFPYNIFTYCSVVE